MATTLLLDQDAWDLCLDASGNWAVAAEPYAQAQDAASEIRVFAGECYYDTTLGVPYFTDGLGQGQPTPVLISKIEAAALRVPGVLSAVAYLNVAQGVLSGQVQLSTTAGNQVVQV